MENENKNEILNEAEAKEEERAEVVLDNQEQLVEELEGIANEEESTESQTETEIKNEATDEKKEEVMEEETTEEQLSTAEEEAKIQVLTAKTPIAFKTAKDLIEILKGLGEDKEIILMCGSDNSTKDFQLNNTIEFMGDQNTPVLILNISQEEKQKIYNDIRILNMRLLLDQNGIDAALFLDEDIELLAKEMEEALSINTQYNKLTERLLDRLFKKNFPKIYKLVSQTQNTTKFL